MNRREFLGAVSFLVSAPRLGAEPVAVKFRKPTPYERYVPLISPANDGFECEVKAEQLAHLLRQYDPDTRYYVLPNDLVRFEKKLAGEYKVGHAKVEWDSKQVRSVTPIWETTARANPRLFREVTADLFGASPTFREQLLHGIPYWRGRIDSTAGIDVYGNNGIAVGDIDNDGWDEIYVCQPGGLPNRLYKRRADGTMEDITDRAGVALLDDTASALFVDFRNSGNQDLLVLRGSGPLLFLNQGNGTFKPKPDAFRFETPPQGTFTGMAAADYDRDGKVDLYLCCYVYFQTEDQYRYPAPYYDARNGPPNFLFANRLAADGSGFFEDVTKASGLNENNDRFSFAAAWCDYDGDGWPDLYVANDFGKKNLYRNDKGHFRDVAGELGVEDTGPGMSAAWFDYDGDGRPDLYVANMWTAAGQRVISSDAFPLSKPELAPAWRGHTMGNSLYKNGGDRSFTSVSGKERVEMGRWAWAADGHDFDNDGHPEVFVTCGMLTNTSDTDLGSFFWRQVVAKSPAANTAAPGYEKGWNALNQFIREDYSWNGHEPNVFYVRDGDNYRDYSGVSGLDFIGDSRAFAVTDLDGDGNLDLVVKNRLGPQVRAFQNNCAAGTNAIVFRLRGTKSNRDAIGARVEVDGQVKFVTAGSGFLSQHTKSLHFGLGNATKAQKIRIEWPSGGSQSWEGLAAGFVYSIQEGSQAPKTVPFKARVASKAATPLPPAKNAPQLEDTWFLEPVPLPDKRSGPGLFVLDEAEARKGETAAVYSILRRYLFDWRTHLELPLALLLDAQGRAVKIYSTLPSAAIVDRDLKLVASGTSANAALPFHGQYYTQPRRSYYKFGGAFFLSGYPEVSLTYFDAALRENPSNEKALNAVGQIQLAAGNTQAARASLEKALRVNPKSFDAWLNLGGVEFTEQRYSDALKSYQQALALRPNSAVALMNLGQTYAKVGDPSKAETLLREAMKADPTDPEPPNQLGLLFAATGKNDEARRQFQSAISIQRDYASAVNNLGVLYQQMGQSNDAIAAFDYGISVAPDEDILYLNLTRAWVSAGDRERAKQTVRRWLDRKPDNATAQRALRDLEAQ